MEAPVLTYVAEITEPRFRGMLAATGSTCLIFGVFTQVYHPKTIKNHICYYIKISTNSLFLDRF